MVLGRDGHLKKTGISISSQKGDVCLHPQEMTQSNVQFVTKCAYMNLVKRNNYYYL